MKLIVSSVILLVGVLFLQAGDCKRFALDANNATAMDHLFDFVIDQLDSEIKARGYNNYQLPNISEQFYSIFGGVSLNVNNATFSDPSTIVRKGPTRLEDQNDTVITLSAEAGLEVFQLTLGNMGVRTVPIDLGLLGEGRALFSIGSNKVNFNITVATVGSNCTVTLNNAEIVEFSDVELELSDDLWVNDLAVFLIDQVPKSILARRIILSLINPLFREIAAEVVQKVDVCSL